MAVEVYSENITAHSEFIWRDGEMMPWEEATVHVRAVGHASVSSVFEGIKAYWNEQAGQLYVFRLKEHIDRLMNSIKMVRLAVDYSGEEIYQAVLELIRANKSREDIYIRPWIYAKGLFQRFMVPADWPAHLVIDMWPVATRLLKGETASACVSSWTRLHDNMMPPRVKAFSNYQNGRMAQMEAQLNGFDYPIMLNDRFKVAEGPGACIGIVRSGMLITPEVNSGVLESITRDTFLQAAPELFGIPVLEREVDRTELYVADEIFCMGTGREVWPITSVDHLPVGDGKLGPVCKALDRGYNDLVRGIDSRREEWRLPVW